MDDPDDEALNKFLMQYGLNDPEWVSRFHEQSITKPGHIYLRLLKNKEELYATLSLGASLQEQAALRKVLGFTDFEENAGKMEVALEPSYWSDIFAKQLGIEFTQAVDCAGSESYPCLKQFARKPWEKKALRKFLKIENEEGGFQRQHKKQREMLKRRLAESEGMIEELKQLQKKGKDQHDQEVQQMENRVCIKLQVSSSNPSWLSTDETLNRVIGQLEAYHTKMNEILKKRELSDISVIQNASGCLALQGVLLTKKITDQLQVRETLLKVTGNVQLMEPCHYQHNRIKQFISKQEEDEFTKVLDSLGYSFAYGEFWGITLEEASSNYSQAGEEKRSEQTLYSSAVKYTIVPLASCYFGDSQLQLSDDAIKQIQNIEKSVTSNDGLLQSQCEEFFHKFGSHVNKGPLHFGGKYQCKCYSHGFQRSDTTAIQKLQSEAINVQFDCAAASVGVSTIDFRDKLQHKYSDTVLSQTFLEVTKTGCPPEVLGIPGWKTGLIACNSTWNLIDRGTTLVPVWDVIKMNHTKNFQETELLAQKLSHAWETMNQYFPEQAKQEPDVSKLMFKIKMWNESEDMSHSKDHLVSLVEVKQSLYRKSMNYQAWSSRYLSQRPLQQFLKSVIDSQQSLPEHQLTEIKLHMRQIVDPITLGAVIPFPSREYICKWLYATENPVPINCLDFQNLQTYFQYALDYMYDGMRGRDPKSIQLAVQLDKSIKATATVTKFVCSVRNHLHTARQKSEDNFVTTMLYPFGYNADESIFTTLLSVCDLEYLCMEFKDQSIELFKVLGMKNVMKIQAYLILLVVKMGNELAVTEFQMKTHLQYLEKQFNDDIDSKVKSCLTELRSTHYNWKLFQSQLECAIQDTSLVQGKEAKSYPSGMCPSYVPTGKDPCRELLSLLGLTDFYPQRLTLRHALEIREDTLTHMKGSKQVHCSNPKLFPFTILQKIMAFDHKCRIKLNCGSIDKLSAAAKKDKGDSETPNEDSDSDLDEESEDEDEKDDGTIHPMDGLLALLHCSDNFLRQDILSRLATCQLAIPLLLPDPFTGKVVFLLWAMQSIIKEWKSTQKSGPAIERPLISHPAPLVSFLRFGTHNLSKSYFLNTILSESKHDRFFHYDCDGGNAKRLLVSGVVEVYWCLPSDSSVFPDVVSFANLHGDAREFSKQVKFLNEVSFMHFVFLNEEDLDERVTQILKDLGTTAPGGIVILRSTHAADKLKLLKKSLPKGKFSDIKLNKNEAEIKEKVRNKINKHLLEAIEVIEQLEASDSEVFEQPEPAAPHYCILEKCRDVARRCGIITDEDKDCLKGKKVAYSLKTIIDQYKDSVKELLPLQSDDLWCKWAMAKKEQHRHVYRGSESLEHYNAQQREKMKLIRQEQFEKAQDLIISSPGHKTKDLIPLMKLFMTSLLMHQGNTRNYFLQWLKLILDTYSRKQLPKLHKEYQQKRKELLKAVDDSDKKTCKEEMDRLNKKLIRASFGLEHLLREIGQFYEAVAYQEKANEEMKTLLFQLPNVAAELLIEGYPLELMDGDAAHVPMKWVSAVLDKVQQKLGNPRLLVLSILGLQSTGKSTLMNTIFGLRFSVSAGRCTRGAFMQLLPINHTLKEECKCDYFLIVDTEGLRAPELDALKTQKHDNELATFVIGLANLTVINIFGEVPGDLNDILQTAVHAFLRMKEVKLSSSCHFVHQNVSAVMAGEKGMIGRLKFREKLDLMTKTAAKEETSEGQYTSFSQVIEFNEESDVSHFPSLWMGDPPMAPVNPGYSAKAEMMKSCFIEFAKQTSLKRARSNMLLPQFKQHMEELWKAILEENFVFSFKNTLEIAAYKTLDTEYSQWSWSLQKVMIEWEQKAYNKLYDTTEISKVSDELASELPNYIQTEYLKVEKKMGTFFDESPEKEMIAKWKNETEKRLSCLYQDLQTHAEKYCQELTRSKKARNEADEMKHSHRRKITCNVEKLVSELKKGLLNDTELRKKFDEQWKEWIKDLRCTAVSKVKVNVEGEVDRSLLDFLNPHRTIVMKKLAKKPLRKWGSPLELKVESTHLQVPGVFGSLAKALGYKWQQCLSQAQIATNKFLRGVESDLAQKQKHDFNPSFTSEVLRNLFQTISKFRSEDVNFNFTDEYKIDMALTASGYALRKFEKMVKDFKIRNDPVRHLELRIREPLWTFFKDEYNQVAQENTAAETFCNLLSKPVEKQVISLLSPAIVSYMKSDMLCFKSKPALKATVLIDIGDNLHQGRTSFRGECTDYLTDVENSLQFWTKRYAYQFCLKNPSMLVSAAQDELKSLVRFIKKTAHGVTEELNPNQEPLDIKKWLDTFYDQLLVAGRLAVNKKELVGKFQHAKNACNFMQQVDIQLGNLQTQLQENFKQLRASVIDQLERKPYDIVFKELAGCTEQCPFCKEQCDQTNKSHTDKHAVALHRSQCLGSYRCSVTGVMTMETCTTLVGSDQSFIGADTNNKAHPYKEYHTVRMPKYQRWSISPDKSLEASAYWKWIVGHYTSEIAKYFGMKEAQIPYDWKTLSWDSVKCDLKNTYKV